MRTGGGGLLNRHLLRLCLRGIHLPFQLWTFKREKTTNFQLGEWKWCSDTLSDAKWGRGITPKSEERREPGVVWPIKYWRLLLNEWDAGTEIRVLITWNFQHFWAISWWTNRDPHYKVSQNLDEIFMGFRFTERFFHKLKHF